MNMNESVTVSLADVVPGLANASVERQQQVARNSTRGLGLIAFGVLVAGLWAYFFVRPPIPNALQMAFQLGPVCLGLLICLVGFGVGHPEVILSFNGIIGVVVGVVRAFKGQPPAAPGS